MIEMLLSKGGDPSLGPSISSDWKVAARLTFNKFLTEPWNFRGTAYQCDVRVYSNDSFLRGEYTGDLAANGKAFTVPISTGPTSLTIWTRPVRGALTYNPGYGVELLCNGMPTGMSVAGVSAIEEAQVRRLWIGYGNGINTISTALSPYIRNFRLYGATVFNSPNVIGWDTSNLITLNNLFYQCNAFNQPIGDWDVSNATGANSFLYRCLNFNQDLSKWKVSQMNDISYMFQENAKLNYNLSSWLMKASTLRTGYDQGCTAWQAQNKPQFIL